MVPDLIISFTSDPTEFTSAQMLYSADSAAAKTIGVPRNFVRGGGGSTNSVDDRGHSERVSGGSSPLVGGSGGSCNLVQEISFHIVKFS